jgi:hypothetical protein
MAKDWWGYDKHLKTWVYLDRSITNNQPEYAYLPFLFLACASENIFEVSTAHWNESRFVFEGRMPELLPNISLSELEVFKTKVNIYKSLLKTKAFNSPRQSTSVFDIFSSPQESRSIQRKKLSPEQIREKYGKEYSDEAWSEVISYVALMKKLGIQDQGKCNEYITRALLWDEFSNIRAMNDHGYGREIEGITRKAYRLVCELMNLDSGFGAPLLHSRQY